MTQHNHWSLSTCCWQTTSAQNEKRPCGLAAGGQHQVPLGDRRSLWYPRQVCVCVCVCLPTCSKSRDICRGVEGSVAEEKLLSVSTGRITHVWPQRRATFTFCRKPEGRQYRHHPWEGSNQGHGKTSVAAEKLKQKKKKKKIQTQRCLITPFASNRLFFSQALCSHCVCAGREHGCDSRRVWSR